MGVVGPQNTWCDNYYCGAFCNHNSNAADNCEATMGDRRCCSEVFTNCAEVQLVGEFDPTASTTAAPVAPTTGAPTATPAPIVSTTTTTTWWGHRIRGVTITIAAPSAIITVTQLTRN